MQVYRVVPLRNNNFNIRIVDVLYSYVFSFDSHFIPILNAAHIQSFKMLQDILVADPECAIRLIIIVLNVS
jgi:hypothetical protein